MTGIRFEPTPEQEAALKRLRKVTGKTVDYLISRAVDELLMNGSTMTREPNEETLQAFEDVKEGRDLETHENVRAFFESIEKEN